PAEARPAWQRGRAVRLADGTERTLRAKLLGVYGARVAAPRGRFFLGDARGRREPALDLYFAEEAAHAAPELGLPTYLVGRGLFLREAFADALAPLERAQHKGLPDPGFERETLRIRGIAAY